MTFEDCARVIAKQKNILSHFSFMSLMFHSVYSTCTVNTQQLVLQYNCHLFDNVTVTFNWQCHAIYQLTFEHFLKLFKGLLFSYETCKYGYFSNFLSFLTHYASVILLSKL